MNGIFPDFTGPSQQEKLNSLYLDFTRPADIVEIPTGGGGVATTRPGLLEKLRQEDDVILAVIIAATERDRYRGQSE